MKMIFGKNLFVYGAVSAFFMVSVVNGGLLGQDRELLGGGERIIPSSSSDRFSVKGTQKKRPPAHAYLAKQLIRMKHSRKKTRSAGHFMNPSILPKPKMPLEKTKSSAGFEEKKPYSFIERAIFGFEEIRKYKESRIRIIARGCGCDPMIAADIAWIIYLPDRLCCNVFKFYFKVQIFFIDVIYMIFYDRVFAQIETADEGIKAKKS